MRPGEGEVCGMENEGLNSTAFGLSLNFGSSSAVTRVGAGGVVVSELFNGVDLLGVFEADEDEDWVSVGNGELFSFFTLDE